MVAFLVVGTVVLIGGSAMTVRVAEQKGRDPTNWVFIALFLTPIIALPALWLLPTAKD